MEKSYWMRDQDQKGNFSNKGYDTFNPKKDYIGIRLQQSVPLLDRDWNELEDIRRYQEMILRRWYIGDGTPDNGFSITCNTADPTKIKISAGRYLVDGFEAVTEDRDDPILGKYEPGKYDLVYLDLWISEIHGTPELKNPQDVNMETCARHKINWEVEVIEIDDFNYFTQDLEAMLNQSGKKEPHHHYSPLALLDRSHAFDAQDPQTIVIDLRGIANCAPITNSISVITKNTDGSYIYIKPGKKWPIEKDLIEDMIPCSSYRYLIWAMVENENRSSPTPGNPATSSLMIYNKLRDYKTGNTIDTPQKDCKSIKVKSEYKGVDFMQYISDQRPFRNGFLDSIENEGENTIIIKRIGFIYTSI